MAHAAHDSPFDAEGFRERSVSVRQRQEVQTLLFAAARDVIRPFDGLMATPIRLRATAPAAFSTALTYIAVLINWRLFAKLQLWGDESNGSGRARVASPACRDAIARAADTTSTSPTTWPARSSLLILAPPLTYRTPSALPETSMSDVNFGGHGGACSLAT